MAYDPNNIFAKILRGEADAHVVLDEEHCLAFMDLMPQSPGHTLIIPREPAESIFELSTAALGQLITTTQRVARAVKAAFKPPGMMIVQLNGADAGQTVFHIHFHVIPRYEGEGLTLHARSVAAPPALREHAARIRAELESQRPAE
ncbi:MAG: HIT family protein [Gammaproteobacteria bacterium]|nr:HIT family protein [Gammaproteobacteria bacterium]